MLARGNKSGETDASIAVLLFLGLPWLLIATWPWCLLAGPSILLMALIVSETFRMRFVQAFSKETLESEISAFRRGLGWIFLLSACLSSIGCLIGLEPIELGWWLVPIFLLTLGIRLFELSPLAGRWASLKGALCTNLRELLTTAFVVLSVYTVALLWLSHLPLDTSTLETLQKWEERVQKVHEFSEHYKPSTLLLVGVLVVAVALRLGAVKRPSLGAWSSRTIMILVKALKWCEVAATAAALAASLTFLATTDNGAAARIGNSLRDAKSKYEHFQHTLTDRVDIALREALLSKAWTERPPELQAAMALSLAFDASREEFEHKQRLAKATLKLPINDQNPFPASLEVPQQPRETSTDRPDDPAPSWTPATLRAVSTQTEKASTGGGTEEPEHSEEFEELLKENFKKISPMDKLFKSPVLELLKAHYPVAGEFLDAVSSSVSEAAFQTIRSWIVSQLTAESLKTSSEPSASTIRELATAEVHGIQFNWFGFDQEWEDRESRLLITFKTEVSLAYARLDKAAIEKQHADFETEIKLLRSRRELVYRVGVETSSDSLKMSAAAMSEYINALSQLEQNWPPLDEPSAEQRRRLASLRTDFSVRFPSETPTAGSLQRSFGVRLGLDGSPAVRADTSSIISSMFTDGNLYRRDTPTAAAVLFNRSCEDQLVRLIAGSQSPAEDDKLRRAMGGQYELFYGAWQERLRQEREETQRKAEERRVAQQQELVRQRELRDQLERNREIVRESHPVEVP